MAAENPAAATTASGSTGATAGAPSPEARIRPRKIGKVTSDKMQKTITVVVERLEKQPVYKKYVRKRTVLKAHDEKNEARIGAIVELEFARPLSKTKRWNLVRILRQGVGD